MEIRRCFGAGTAPVGGVGRSRVAPRHRSSPELRCAAVLREAVRSGEVGNHRIRLHRRVAPGAFLRVVRWPSAHSSRAVRP